MKKLLLSLLRPTYLKVTALIITAFLLLMVINPRFINNLEMKFYDLMFQLRGPLPVGQEVVIIAIDEASIKEIGRWPWPRKEITRLLEVLQTAGAKVIGFDIIFAEKEDSCEVDLLGRLQKEIKRRGWQAPELERWLARESQVIDPDTALANELKKCGAAVLGYYFYGLESASAAPGLFSLELSTDRIKSSVYDLVRYTSAHASPSPLVSAQGVETNLSLLNEAAAETGYFNAIPDADGAIRTLPLVVRYQEDLFAPLSLSILQRYLGNPPLQVTLAETGVLAVNLGERQVPVDDYGRFRINFRGPARSFPYYSFIDVVSGKVPPETFRDRIVLVGASAVGIYDVRITPFSSIFPGVEVHANIIDNILRGDFLWAPKGLMNPASLVVIFMGLAVCYLLPRMRAWFGPALLGLLIYLYGHLNFYLFTRHQIYLQMLYPLGALLTVYVAVAFMRFMAEEKERKRIRAAFQNYVAPEVVNTMLQHPEKLHLGGEKREMTVLFSDIRGFTSISEQMEPEALVDLLHSYLNPMTEIVFKHKGTMDKYIGDAIMAIYGAPLLLPNHADPACETALEMIDTLERLDGQWRRAGLPELKIGIGINSGVMTVGNMGSERLFDYTVIGDNVNLASRLEGLNKYYGTAILISGATRNLLSGGFILREVDKVRVKGKKAPVGIFELRGRGRPEGDEAELLDLFQAGLKAFRQQQWPQAERYFADCLRIYPQDGPATLLLGRIRTFAQQPPPPDWDGAATLTEK